MQRIAVSTFISQLIFVLILVLVLTSHNRVLAEDGSSDIVDARIKGVAQFLLDRAQDNFLYILGQNIKEHDKFKKYFPNTHYFISTGDLTLLLKSSQKVWSEIVERDLREMIERYIIIKIGTDVIINQLKEKLNVGFLEKEINVRLQKYIDTLDQNQMKIEPKIKHELRRRLVDYQRLLEKLKTAIVELHQISFDDCKNDQGTYATDICKNAWEVFSKDSWKNYMRKLAEIGAMGHKIFSGIRDDIDNGRFSEADLPYVPELWEFVKSRDNSSWWVLNLSDASGECRLDQGYTQTIIQFKNRLISIASSNQPLNLKFLEFERLAIECKDLTGLNNETSKTVLEMFINSREYKRFRKYVLFFTQLTEADSADQVEALLVEMTLPPASYGIKRETGERHLMFSGYLGFIGGLTYSTAGDNDFDSEGGYVGITAPMGVEWTYGGNSKEKDYLVCSGMDASFNMLIAPFDFAHPINIIVTDNDDNVELEDIVAPGIFISKGCKNYPVAWGFGWQQGKSIRADSELENRYFLFVAFEIPMFVLH